MTMKIKAIAPWAGAKRNLAGKIIEQLGKHRVYWELCAGSLAVLLAKEPCVMETAVDLHGDMTNLAFVLQDEDMAIDLYGRAARTLMSDELFADARQRLLEHRTAESDIPHVERAFDYLLASWLGRNGVAGARNSKYGFCVRYTANGGHAAKRWRSVVESIPAWHYRLLNVTILRRDIFEVAERIEDKAGTAIYCDPPYFEKGFKYVHDFEPEDHVRLAAALDRFKQARVVVSYYEHEQLAELYPGWTKHKIDVSKALAHQGRRGTNNTKAIEVLLTNDRSGQQGLFT